MHVVHPAADRLLDLTRPTSPDLRSIARAFDAMDGHQRVVAMRALGKAQQARLWDAAAGQGARIEDIVPADAPPGVELIHEGKNTLPGPDALTCFQKRFCRVDGDSSILYGYNEGKTRAVIGPGYFVTRYFEDRREAGVDYYSVPPADARLPVGWPKVIPNEVGLQALVFAKMIDYLRRVSEHVLVGRAYRKGRMTDNYFLLCRAER